jgi:hypothetical protein
MKIAGQDIKQEQKQTFLFSWEVKTKDDAKKETTIEQKIEGVKMEITIGGNVIKFDSTDPSAAENPLSSFFKPLVGSSFKLTLNDKMEVTKIEGRDTFVKKLKDANPTMAPLLDRILDENQLKQMSEPAFAVVPGPNVDVSKDKTWKRPPGEGTIKLNMGPIGTYDAKYTYTYEGTEKVGAVDLHKIKMETELKYAAPSGDQASGLPFKIESGNLDTKEKPTGTILFNKEKGRVEKTSMKVGLKGNLKIKVGETSAEVTLDQDQTTDTTTHDADPWKK